jgi:hypothetical protein
MNATTKPLSGINQKIKDLANQVLEIENYNVNDYFNTREGKICANIRVYEWLDKEDVKNVIKNQNAELYKDEILNEFDDNRLENIYHHISEIEVEYAKKMYESNCDLDNPYKDYQRYTQYYNSNFKSWPIQINTYRDKNGVILNQTICTYKEHYKNVETFRKRKNNTPKDYLKFLRKNNTWSFNEYDRRSLIDFEVWQYGRSGGWLSICDKNQLENQEFESYDFYTDISYLESIDDNQEFNKVLRDELNVSYSDKKAFIDEMQTFIDNWTEKKDAIEYYVNEVEKNVKCFKECLTEQLSHEISEFISEELQVETSNVVIKLEENKVKTTLGVSVDLNTFKIALKDTKPLFKTLKEVGQTVAIKRRVGQYFVEYAKKVEDDILVKAGCHRFSLKNINQVLNQ